MRSSTRAIMVALLFLVAQAQAEDFPLEEGFTLLLGKDFTGWKTEKGESLAGKDEAYTRRFSIREGILHIDPTVKGDVKIFTQREFDKDLHIKFDFRPDAKCNNDLFLRGMKFDLSSANLKAWQVGEWNEFEIVIQGENAEFRLNGTPVKKMAAKAKATGLGIRAEFGTIEIRRLRVKEG